MAFNGSGVFSRTNGVNAGATVWAQDYAGGVDVVYDRHDTHDQDIANGLSKCLLKDGQQTPTANLPMGTFKFTGLGAGSARTDSVNLGQIQDGAVLYGGVSTGAAGVYAISLSPAITAYVDGAAYRFVADKNAAGSDTLNINGVGAKTMVAWLGSTGLAALDFLQYAEITAVYNQANDKFVIGSVQRLDRASAPTFAGGTFTAAVTTTSLVSSGAVSGTSGTFSASVTSPAYSGATGTFSGTVTMGDAVVNGLTASRYVSTDAAKKLASGTSQQVADDVLPNATETTTWTSAHTPSGSMTFGTPSDIYQRYLKIGKMVFIVWYFNGTIGGSHAANETITVTMPVQAANIGDQEIPIIIDNGATEYIGKLTITTNTTTGVIKLPNSGTNQFANGATFFKMNLHYEGA